MYRIAICDDHKKILEITKQKIQFYCNRKEIGIVISEYSDSEQLWEDLENKNFCDAYFLDIEMPKHTGMEIAEYIQANHSLSFVIFLTAYESYAVEACHMNIFWYLCKDRLNSEMDRILDKLFLELDKQEDEGMYLIQTQRIYAKFYVKEIIYAYKVGKNMEFALTEGRKIQERITIKELYKKLNGRVLQLDRGTLLNPVHIQKINKNEIIMVGGYHLEVNPERIIYVKKQLEEFWKKDIL